MRHSENLFHVIIHFIIYSNLKTESSLPIDKEEERDSLVDSSDSDDMDVKRSREWKIITISWFKHNNFCVGKNINIVWDETENLF